MSCKVMIVDDDANIRLKVKEILERHGIATCMAETGYICLENFKNGFQGLVLMDAAMPELDGWDTVSRLVSEGYINNAIVCMITGYSEPSSKMDVLKEHVIDYIVKPFSIQELVETVQNYLAYFENNRVGD